MIGFLVPNRLDLTIRQNRQYHASRCGLCQQLKTDYGVLARFLVNYDALVLQLLVEAQSSTTPAECSIRCGTNPLRHTARAEAVAARFAAAVSVLMAVAKVRDQREDARGLTRWVVRSVCGLLLWLTRGWERRAIGILADLGFDYARVDELLIRQRQLEAAESDDPAEAAVPTAEGLAALFAHTAVLAGTPERGPALAEVGRSTGAAIYLLDARDDLRQDLRLRNYNPFAACNHAGGHVSDTALVESTVAAAVQRARRTAIEVLEDLPLERDETVLRHILADSLTERSCMRNSEPVERTGLGYLSHLASATASGGCCIAFDNICNACCGGDDEGSCISRSARCCR
jgi:hypothetical protein